MINLNKMSKCILWSLMLLASGTNLEAPISPNVKTILQDIIATIKDELLTIAIQQDLDSDDDALPAIKKELNNCNYYKINLTLISRKAAYKLSKASNDDEKSKAIKELSADCDKITKSRDQDPLSSRSYHLAAIAASDAFKKINNPAAEAANVADLKVEKAYLEYAKNNNYKKAFDSNAPDYKETLLETQEAVTIAIDAFKFAMTKVDPSSNDFRSMNEILRLYNNMIADEEATAQRKKIMKATAFIVAVGLGMVGVYNYFSNKSADSDSTEEETSLSNND